jgi:hypothetical protein
MSPEILQEQEQRSRAIWDELVSRIDGPLPFVRVDPNNPKAITSLWDVTTSESHETQSPKCPCRDRAQKW